MLMGPTIINQYQLVTIQNGKFSYEFVSFEYVVYNFARSSTFLKCFEREKAKRRGVQLPITLSSIVVPGGPPSLQLKKSLKQNHMKNQKREKNNPDITSTHKQSHVTNHDVLSSSEMWRHPISPSLLSIVRKIALSFFFG